MTDSRGGFEGVAIIGLTMYFGLPVIGLGIMTLIAAGIMSVYRRNQIKKSVEPVVGYTYPSTSDGQAPSVNYGDNYVTPKRNNPDKKAYIAYALAVIALLLGVLQEPLSNLSGFGGSRSSMVIDLLAMMFLVPLEIISVFGVPLAVFLAATGAFAAKSSKVKLYSIPIMMAALVAYALITL